MSTKTTFKRIALVAVAALGLGVLSVAPAANASVIGETLTLSSSSSSITLGETATTTFTHTFTQTTVYGNDSRTIRTTCDGPVGANCGALFYWSATADSSTATTITSTLNTTTFTDSLTVGNSSGSIRVTGSVKLVSNSAGTGNTANKAGTYKITMYTTDQSGAVTTVTPVIWTITIAAENSTIAGLNAYMTKDLTYGMTPRLAMLTGSDSSVVVPAGSPAVPTNVANIYMTAKNSAGETTTAGGTNLCTSGCSITAVISGPGFLSVNGGTSKLKAVTVVTNNSSTLNSAETLSVWSDGTAGTGTISFSSSTGVALGSSKTVVFHGLATSATPTLTDTGAVTTVGASGPHLTIAPKDSAGNAITTQTMFLYSSDTSVISDSATACSANAAGVYSCSITAVDSGTATIYVRDSSTVALSTFISTGVTIRVAGTKVSSITATFDKANYTPGEKAILTITAKDYKGGLMDGAALANAFTVTPNRAWTDITTPTTFTPYYETGVETRVVYMPTTGGTFEYKISAGTNARTEMVAVTASASVTDPTKDAADAATDAALEATDAAYAAQDAAQLAAEAADAATAAAEAATAAVEDLATQVASLFADLQKQITTLANVVAKIAKKVKA